MREIRTLFTLLNSPAAQYSVTVTHTHIDSADDNTYITATVTSGHNFAFLKPASNLNIEK